MDSDRGVSRTKSDFIAFTSVTCGAISLAWTSIEILEYFGVSLAYIKSLGYLSIYIVVTHSMILGAAFVLFRRPKVEPLIDAQNDNPDVPHDVGASFLADDLVNSLKSALSSRKFYEVIRVGSALSRPLFESGNYNARLNIGVLVEEAAATVGDQKTQMVELIDSIGWSCVEIGDLERAKREILHGLELAQAIGDYFYISKANRHLGVINRKQKNYEEASSFYGKALEVAQHIKDDVKRRDATSGIEYAYAALCLHTSNFDGAVAHIDNAITGFTESSDSYRLTLALTMKGKICLALGRLGEAKDIFRKAYNNAEESSQRLQAIRCLIGLTEIYVLEKEWIKAGKFLKSAEKLAVDTNSESELAEIGALIKTFPQNIIQSIPSGAELSVR